jgi:hypothetical protein
MCSEKGRRETMQRICSIQARRHERRKEEMKRRKMEIGLPW